MAKNRIEFWFKDRHNTYLQLPVNPQTIEYTSPFGLTKVNITNLGEVATPSERGLKQITFSSFFPRDYNPSYCEYEGFLEPWKWVDQIEAWRDDRRNVRLIIAGTPISLPVYLEDFTLEPERAGSPGDIYYSITLTEFKPSLAKITDVNVKGVSTTRPSSGSSVPNTHTVVYSDTLWSIARYYYKDGSKQAEIYEANKEKIGKDSTLLKVGMVLTLP